MDFMPTLVFIYYNSKKERKKEKNRNTVAESMFHLMEVPLT